MANLYSNRESHKVVSKERERELFFLMNNKSEESDKREFAKDELILHNLCFVKFIAVKFLTTGIEMDDLVSIGTLGLIRAVETFKYDKGLAFTTYAYRCISNSICMVLRKRNPSKIHQFEISIDEPIMIDNNGKTVTYQETIASDEDITENVERDEDIALLYQFILELNDKEKTVLELRYGLNGKEKFTQQQISEALNISRSYICRIEKTAIKKLRKHFERIRK